MVWSIRKLFTSLAARTSPAVNTFLGIVFLSCVVSSLAVRNSSGPRREYPIQGYQEQRE
jgi:hypothetical protein